VTPPAPRPPKPDTTLALFVLAAALSFAPVSRGQAWLPPKGDASLSLGYQYYYSTDYTCSEGCGSFYDGDTSQHALVAYLTYGVTDRLAVSLGLPPYYVSRYNGPDPHTAPVLDANGRIARDASGAPLYDPPARIDDGSYHASFQDFRAELSYMALQEPLVVTPFVGAVVPSHAYDFYAQTAVGRRLWDVRIGANVGRRLDPLLPDAYVQGRYVFAYRQKTQGLRFNYSYLDLELGYFVTPSLALRFLGAGQFPHDGLHASEYPPAPPQPSGTAYTQWYAPYAEGHRIRGRDALQLFLHHDQLDYQSNFNLGLGASYAVTPSLDIATQAYRAVHVRGGRGAEIAVSLWATISFTTGRRTEPLPALERVALP
jgi:hypothetical protein